MTHRWGGFVCKMGGRRQAGQTVGLYSSQGNIRCVLNFCFFFFKKKEKEKPPFPI
jgi:hypothetical protein